MIIVGSLINLEVKKYEAYKGYHLRNKARFNGHALPKPKNQPIKNKIFFKNW
jgi:hypothetical protein